MKILMTPHFYETERHFVHYLCFSDTHILPDGHFPIDLAHLWYKKKKKKLKHYGTIETLHNGSPHYVWEFLTVPQLQILHGPNVIAKVTHGSKWQPGKL